MYLIVKTVLRNKKYNVSALSCLHKVNEQHNSKKRAGPHTVNMTFASKRSLRDFVATWGKFIKEYFI